MGNAILRARSPPADTAHTLIRDVLFRSRPVGGPFRDAGLLEVAFEDRLDHRSEEARRSLAPLAAGKVSQADLKEYLRHTVRIALLDQMPLADPPDDRVAGL
jgi:hypothetical protein